MNHIERTVHLLRGLYAGKLSREEEEEARQLLENQHIRQVYEEWGDDERLKEELQRYAKYNPMKGKAAFEGKLQSIRAKRWRKRLLAAASCAILLGSGFLFWEQQQKTPMPVSAPTTAVGENALLLRLANGEEVFLKHDQQDVMTEEENTLIHVDNGRLSYENAPSSQTDEIKYNELYIPRGSECLLTLADGSKVWLNADSYLKYPVRFAGDNRQVEMRGEAYFEVVSDGRPFFVQSPSGTVQVVGTSFGVRDYAGERAMTTLVTGKVACTSNSGERVELSPGEQAYVSDAGKLEKRTVDVTEYVSWREGWFIFREELLENVMQMMCRWYDVEVFYQTPQLKELRFTGNLRRYDTIETFLQILAESCQVRYNLNGKTVILYE